MRVWHDIQLLLLQVKVDVPSQHSKNLRHMSAASLSREVIKYGEMAQVKMLAGWHLQQKLCRS